MYELNLAQISPSVHTASAAPTIQNGSNADGDYTVINVSDFKNHLHQPKSSRPTSNGFDPAQLEKFLSEQRAKRSQLTSALHNFLTALGYVEGDRVYVRALLPKGLSDEKALAAGLKFKSSDGQLVPNTRRGYIEMGAADSPNWPLTHIRRDKEPKVYTDGLGELGKLNAQGRGIYFVVNPGGEHDRDITEARVLCWEADDKPLDEQADIASAFEFDTEGGLAAIVRTVKSLHCYVRLENAIAPDTFTERQHQLIEYCESDPAIFNPARLMRLPGFDHVSTSGEGLRQKLVFKPVVLEHCDRDAVTTELLLNGTLGPLTETAEQAKAKGRKTATGKANRSAEKRAKRSESASGKGSAEPSAAAGNPWDIRNFAHYLNGYGDDTRPNYTTCQCPVHTADNPDAHSTNSLHIREDNGAFICHAGCDPKEVYAAAKAIALEHGHKFGPRPQSKAKPQTKTEWKAQQRIERDKAAYQAIAQLLGSVADGWADAAKIEQDGYQQRARGFFYPLLRIATGYDMGGDIVEGYVSSLPIHLDTGDRALLVYDASKGTGKSNSAIIPAALRAARGGQRTLIIVPTRGLSKEFKGRINEQYGSAIACTHQDGNRDYALIVVTCPESLYRFKGQRFKHMVLDETNEDFQRLESGELGQAGPQSLKAAHQLMSAAQTVTIASANVTSWAVSAAQRMGRFSIAQTHIQRVQRPQTDMGIVVYSNFWHWVDEIVQAVAAGQRVSIATGSQGKGRMLDRILNAKFPNLHGVIIDGKATLSTVRSRFLADPDGFLTEQQPSWFIFTPVINSGVSIEDSHFDVQFEYLTPHESAQSASQRGERVRSAIGRDGAIRARHVYFSTQGAPTIESYPEALNWEYWANELANTANAPMGAAAALAKAIGAEKALNPLKQDAAALAALRPELANFMTVAAFDVLFKRELLVDEWSGYGWDICPAAKPTPGQHESIEELRLFAEDIVIGLTRQQGRILKKARAAAAVDSCEIEGPLQAAKVAKGSIEAVLGKDFLAGQGADFFTAWFADKSGANPGIKAVVRSQLLKFAVDTPKAFAELEKIKALKFLAGKADRSKGEFWNLPELPAPARDIELVGILSRCPGVALVQNQQLTTWTAKNETVIAAGLYLIAHGGAIATNTKHSGLQRGAVFSGAMAPAALFNKALELCGLKPVKAGRQGSGQRLNEYRLATSEDASEALSLLRADKEASPMQLFKAELANIRAQSHSEVSAAAYATVHAKLKEWVYSSGQKSSAIEAIKARHADLMKIRVSDLGDGGDGGGSLTDSYTAIAPQKKPPLATSQEGRRKNAEQKTLLH